MPESKLIKENSLQYLSEGITLQETGNNQEAIKKLKEALDVDPSNYLASYLIGICFGFFSSGISLLTAI